MKYFTKLIFCTCIISFLSFTKTYSQGVDWQQTNGPFGGRVYNVGVSNNGNLFALTNSQLYRSPDKGQTWTIICNNLTNPTEIIRSRNGYIAFVDGNKIYKSTDNGDSWKRTEIPVNWSDHFFSDKNGNLFLSSNNKVFYSYDDGISWGANQNTLPFYTVSGLASDGVNFYLSSDNGIYRSIDKGITWTNVNNNLPAGLYNCVYTKNGKVFAGKQGAIYSSTDNGQTWNLGSSGSYEYVWSFSEDSSGNLYAVTSLNILETTDMGKTWIQKNVDHSTKFADNITFTIDGDSYAAGLNGVVHFLPDLTNPRVITTGIIGTNIYDVKAMPSGNIIAVTPYDLFISSDKGTTWRSTNSSNFTGQYAGFSVDVNDKDIIYYSYPEGFIKSTDFGITWTKYPISGYGCKSFAFGKNGLIYGLTNNSIVRSTNDGLTWEAFESHPEESILSTIHLDNFGSVYYFRENGVYKCAAGSTSFDKMTTSTNAFTCMMINRKGYIYAGTSKGILLSTNQGKDWTQLSVTGYTDNYIYSLDETSDRKILTNSTYGLYMSTNDGISWTKIDDNDSRGFYTKTLTVDTDGYLYAGSIQEGVFKTKTPFVKIHAPEPMALPGNQKAFLSWDKSTSSAFNIYKIYGGSSHYPSTLLRTVFGGANDTAVVIENLANGVPYYFVVSAVDNDGNESFSDEFSVTPIPAPSVPGLVSPVNGTSNIPLALQLSWNKSLNASSYYLQVATDSNFVNLFADYADLTDSVKQLTGLSYLTTYYWRVKAKGAVEESSWSQKYSFTTIIEAPEKTASVLPVNNAVNLPIQQTFSWLASARAQRYHLQVASDDAFTSLVINDSTLADTTYSKTLAHNKKYFWRVEAANIGGSGAWSDTWNFTTIIAAPDSITNFYPAANAVNVPVLFNFKWNKSQWAETYHFQLAQDSLFENTIIDDSTLADTLISSGMLTFDTRYFWRVKAKNIGGTTEWSRVVSFTTVIAAPDAPYLSQPANDSTGLPVNLKFSWFKLNNAEKYHLQVSESKTFTSFAFNDSLLTDTLKQVSNLKNKTVYYWRVRGVNIGGNSEWSEVWSFKTIVAIPAAPVLASPANGGKNIVKNTLLKWNAVQDAETYKLQVFTDAALSSAFDDDSTITTAEKQLSGLKSGMKYFWRVNAKNDAGTGSFSPVWSFITLLETPAISAETAGIRTNKLTWTDNSDNESGFIVERNTNGQAGYKLLDTVKANETTYTDSTASSAVTYKYRVKAYTEFVVSDYSNEAVVTTITAVNDNMPLPTEYSIKQNYPNPFNPSTMIEYNLPYESNVKVIIYNSIGQMVAELAGGVKPAGHYQVSFNAISLASGIYFCSIKAESTDGKDHFNSIKKMILMK